ncbi:GNAT family N-acetyltransferase, partial [Planococcus sp. SIMBA_143]
AMRKAVGRTGFVKEARLRQAWVSPEQNRYHEAVTYGMTREDWEAGVTRPVMWDDAVKAQAEPPFNRLLLEFPEKFEAERLL